MIAVVHTQKMSPMSRVPSPLRTEGREQAQLGGPAVRLAGTSSPTREIATVVGPASSLLRTTNGWVEMGPAEPLDKTAPKATGAALRRALSLTVSGWAAMGKTVALERMDLVAVVAVQAEE